ncbi:hypothetical protein HYU16_04655 [Candidatus Woesearchaeota archaeon]|nr:hypothetical protein [Candidatus Woesearchaeota archaeon]
MTPEKDPGELNQWVDALLGRHPDLVKMLDDFPKKPFQPSQTEYQKWLDEVVGKVIRHYVQSRGSPADSQAQHVLRSTLVGGGEAQGLESLLRVVFSKTPDHYIANGIIVGTAYGETPFKGQITPGQITFPLRSMGTWALLYEALLEEMGAWHRSLPFTPKDGVDLVSYDLLPLQSDNGGEQAYLKMRAATLTLSKKLAELKPQ